MNDPFEKVFQNIDPLKEFSDDQIETLMPVGNILRRIQVDIETKRRGRFIPTRHRVAVISTVAVLAISGTAAALTLLRSPVRDTSSLACYSQDSLTAKLIEVFPYNSKPLEFCRSEMDWKNLGEGKKSHGAVCVLSNGTLGAFPSNGERGACAKLGLSVFNGKLKYPLVSKFEAAATDFFSHHQCVSRNAGRARVLALMGRYGLIGWHLHETGSGAAGACATFDFDVASRTIHIVGILR
jgi:hypothetical protein